VNNLQKAIGRIPGLENKETLCNGLSEIAEGYMDGWDSGSDLESDD
jgi:hypothetical protein